MTVQRNRNQLKKENIDSVLRHHIFHKTSWFLTYHRIKLFPVKTIHSARIVVGKRTITADTNGTLIQEAHHAFQSTTHVLAPNLLAEILKLFSFLSKEISKDISDFRFACFNRGSGLEAKYNNGK